MTIDQVITVAGAAKAKLNRAFIHLQRINPYDTAALATLNAAWTKLDDTQQYLVRIKKGHITSL